MKRHQETATKENITGCNRNKIIFIHTQRERGQNPGRPESSMEQPEWGGTAARCLLHWDGITGDNPICNCQSNT